MGFQGLGFGSFWSGLLVQDPPKFTRNQRAQVNPLRV